MQPTVPLSHHLTFVGDWGQANFHRICSWLCEEFCKRAGRQSRVAIWNIRDGGIEAIQLLQVGEVDLSIATPSMLLPSALSGELVFSGQAAPNLRALAVLPQNDRMIFALKPELGIESFAQLRERKPALRIAASCNDGTNFIGYVGRLLMEAHGIDESTLASWGGGYVEDVKPNESLERMKRGEVDAVLQEAIMTPWWADIIESGMAVVLPAEDDALTHLHQRHGFPSSPIPAGHWRNVNHEISALDFSDFVVLVRDDMPEEVAHLLTWCLVETRHTIEQQYKHLPPHRSPLSYPIVPEKMAQTSVPLHPGARRYFVEAGLLGPQPDAP